VRETRGGTTTDLYYSPAAQVLEERVGGLVQSQYVWSPGYVDALVERDRDTNADGTLDERLYAAHDANFNVTAVFDTSGNVVERYAYDPFGAATVLTPAFASRPSTLYAWDRLHQGLESVSEIGLYADRARWLSPGLGRFTSVDPLGFGGGDANFYGYVGNGPTGGLDPSGLAGLWGGGSNSAGYGFYGGLLNNQVVDAAGAATSYLYDQLPSFDAGGSSGGSGGGGSGVSAWDVLDGARRQASTTNGWGRTWRTGTTREPSGRSWPSAWARRTGTACAPRPGTTRTMPGGCGRRSRGSSGRASARGRSFTPPKHM